ncbi:MAG: hypothetical protein ACJAZP_000893 [Psychromonas sp.]|jgi:hypothetical protein|uniref:hypothetical protein n=1 Tax=Psychromonas sp. TaxID=1884585 RepID=UPI0039E33F1A
MVTNKQDDKALTEDEAFIQSLYDDLSDHKTEHQTDQPSEALDQHIIKAAHKAVETNPAPSIDKALNRPAPKRRKVAWYYPVAMAASVLLVVTMVNHQLSGPIYETPSVLMDNMESSEQSESLVASLAEKNLSTASDQTLRSSGAQPALTDKILIKESDAAFFERDQALIASAVSPDKKAIIEEQSKTAIVTAPLTAKIQQSELVMTSKAEGGPSVKEKLLSKQQANSLLSPTALSHEEYKALQAQSQQKTLYWSMQQEDQRSYVIKLFKTEQTSVFYRLNKNSFQLKQSRDDKSQPFAEIIYIAENDK